MICEEAPGRGVTTGGISKKKHSSNSAETRRCLPKGFLFKMRITKKIEATKAQCGNEINGLQNRVAILNTRPATAERNNSLNERKPSVAESQ